MYSKKNSENYISHLSWRKKGISLYETRTNFKTLNGQITLSNNEKRKSVIERENIYWRGILILYIFGVFSVIACCWLTFSFKKSCLLCNKKTQQSLTRSKANLKTIKQNSSTLLVILYCEEHIAIWMLAFINGQKEPWKTCKLFLLGNTY